MKRLDIKRLPSLQFHLTSNQRKHLADKLMDAANGVLLSLAVGGFFLEKKVGTIIMISAVIAYFLLTWYTLWLQGDKWNPKR